MTGCKAYAWLTQFAIQSNFYSRFTIVFCFKLIFNSNIMWILSVDLNSFKFDFYAWHLFSFQLRKHPSVHTSATHLSWQKSTYTHSHVGKKTTNKHHTDKQQQQFKVTLAKYSPRTTILVIFSLYDLSCKDYESNTSNSTRIYEKYEENAHTFAHKHTNTHTHTGKKKRWTENAILKTIWKAKSCIQRWECKGNSTK